MLMSGSTPLRHNVCLLRLQAPVQCLQGRQGPMLLEELPKQLPS